MSLIQTRAQISGTEVARRLREFAHRGASDTFPENTLLSYGAADVINVTKFNRWAEGDCRITSDGKLVMMHDATLNRTTNGTGNVVDRNLAYIKGLDAGSWKDSSYSGTEVPTWEEVCTLSNTHKLKFFLELTSAAWTEAQCTEALGFWTDEGNPMQNIIVQSFDIDSLDNMRAVNSNVWCYINDGNYTVSELISMCNARSKFGVFINKTLATSTNMATFISANIDVNVYTLTTYSEKTTMISRGVKGITSNSYLTS